MWKLLEIEGFLDLFGRFDCRFGMSFPAIIIAPFLSVLHGQLFQHLSHQALVLSLLQRLSDLNTARRRREGGKGRSTSGDQSMCAKVSTMVMDC